MTGKKFLATKSCFAHSYSIPFATFFQDEENPSNPIQITINQDIEVSGANIHSAIDFLGGPVLDVYEANQSFILDYAQYRARLLKHRIDISGPIADIARITQILERVVFPIHLLLHSPNLVPLHGGAILFSKLAYVFLGESGAGKSTTVLELLKRGAKIISDDLVFIDTNTMQLLPGLPTLRLLQPVDLKSTTVERVGPGIEKWWHILNQKQLQDPLPIEKIFFLKPGEESFRTLPAKGFAKTAALLSQTFGLTNAGDEREKKRFEEICKIADTVPIEELRFRKGRTQPIHIDKLASYLESI